MAYTTETPKLFSQFFTEVIDTDEFRDQKALYEKCHGKVSDIEVCFSREIAGRCARALTEKDDGSYEKVVHYNFMDKAETKCFCRRLLLVTVAMA